MKKTRFIIREFKCPECGIVVTAPKNRGHKTGNGHIKTMWCYKCKEDRDFEQIGIVNSWKH